jgi:hypothetical protein
LATIPGSNNGADALALADGTTYLLHRRLCRAVEGAGAGIGRTLPDLKVIYMSGYTGQGVGNSGELRALGQFLPKPFTREVLARKVRRTLDSRAASASA